MISETQTPVEIIQSKPWPKVRAEIFRHRHSNGVLLWRTKIGSLEYPDLVTHRIFGNLEGARAHANIVLGN